MERLFGLNFQLQEGLKSVRVDEYLVRIVGPQCVSIEKSGSFVFVVREQVEPGDCLIQREREHGGKEDSSESKLPMQSASNQL